MTALQNITGIVNRLMLLVIRFRKRYVSSVSSQGGTLLLISSPLPPVPRNYCSAQRGKASSQFMIHYAKNLLLLPFAILHEHSAISVGSGQVRQEKTGLSQKAVSSGLHSLETAILYSAPDKLCLTCTKITKALVAFCITMKHF